MPPRHHALLEQDATAELRARRQRAIMSAAQSGRIRRGMIRYVLLVRACMYVCVCCCCCCGAVCALCVLQCVSCRCD